MQFTIKNTGRGMNDLMRTIGYKPAYFQKAEEASLVRSVSRTDYPRFHLYIKGDTFNLHLDQKKPSYEGQTGHSGDYDGEVVEREAQRIRELLGSSF